MNYMKIYIYCKPELLETAGAVLIANNIAGYITNDPNNLDYLNDADSAPWDYIEHELQKKITESSNIEFYVPLDVQGKQILNDIKVHFDTLNDKYNYRISVDNVDDSTWINKWKEFFKPLTIGENFYIKPSWEEIHEEHTRKVIEIDPENSFGSGTHATTQLCLMELEKLSPADKSVLDLGCGSGILGIGAKLLGANDVTFVDIDNHCIVTSRKNAQINNLDLNSLTFMYGNILDDNELVKDIGHNKYDIVFVNIMADIIIAMIPMLDIFLSESGVIIFSGIITQRLDDVVECLNNNGYDNVEVNTMDNWCAVTAKNRIRI